MLAQRCLLVGLVPLVGVCATLLGPGTAVAAPTTAALGPPPTLGSAAIGDRFGTGGLATTSGYKSFPAGPDLGPATATVDASAGTVDVTVDDAGRRSVATLAWPARVGSWSLAVSGAEPEQHVVLRRGTASCTLTSGTLEVREAVSRPDGGVGTLVAEVRSGSCSLGSNVGGSAGLAVRVGTTDPLPGTGRAVPAALDTGAPLGTPVSQRVVVTNAGGTPWSVRAAGTGSVNSSRPLFTVVPGSDTCTGVTLEVGGQCELTVSATSPSHFVREHLVVAGDGAADVVVPLRLEGYVPPPAPAGVAAEAGRLGTTVSWDAPAAAPRVGYRVYDVTDGQRVRIGETGRTSLAVRVPVRGPRDLALVAADGPFAESRDVLVQVPAVAREIVAQSRYEHPIAFTEPAAGTLAPGRPSSLGWTLRLDPARTSWGLATADGVRVCSVDHEVCVPVPGTGPSGTQGAPREVAWLPDGRIAFTAEVGPDTALLVVGRDGTGLRRVALLRDQYGQLAAAPDGTQVVLRGGVRLTLVRVRLVDGLLSEVPGTQDVDDFSVTTSGRLVLERRVDQSQSAGPTRVSVTALDGSGSRDLALPPGDNRQVTFDPPGSRLAFVRHTPEGGGTVWLAVADGSGARQISDRSGWWHDLEWSVDDAAAPVAALTGPAVSGASTSLSVGASDADDPVGSLRRECRLDTATTWSPCGPTWALSRLAAGPHTAYARVSGPSGRQSALTSRSWTVDSSAPLTTVNALDAVQTTSTPTLSWTSTDAGGAGVASYDVQLRQAALSGTWSAPSSSTTWQRRTTTTLPLSLRAGYQYCFAVRAVDKAANVGPWSAERCTSALLDDRSLSASSRWTRGTSSAYASGTYSRATSTGADLIASQVSARRLAVVAATCATCGSVDVFHAGVRLGRISLASSSTAYRQVRWLALRPTALTGTVTVRTVDSRPVYVDGIAVQH